MPAPSVCTAANYLGKVEANGLKANGNTYTNDADRQNIPPHSGKPFYSDFVRLYTPAGSALLGTTGLDEPWPTYTVHNKTQFSGYFTLRSHRSRTLTFRYRVPADTARRVK